MHSFAHIVLVVSSLLSTTLAQSADFNASAVPEGTRDAWCNDQVSQCPNLCEDLGKSTVKNNCFPDNLQFLCLCSDNVSPNLTQYSQTIPYYECTTNQANCVTDCGAANNDCASQCKKTFVCGATDPKKGNATASASKTASATSTGAMSTGTDGGTGFAHADGSSSTSNAARAFTLEAGYTYGLGVVVAGIAVGAAMIGL